MELVTVTFREEISAAELQLSLKGWSEALPMSKLKSPLGGTPGERSVAERKYFPTGKLLNVTEYGGAEVNCRKTAPCRSITKTMFVVPAGAAGVAMSERFVADIPPFSVTSEASLIPVNEIPAASALRVETNTWERRKR